VPSFQQNTAERQEPWEEKGGSQTRIRWTQVATVLGALAALITAGLWIWVPRTTAEEAFWAPVLAARKPAVVWATGWGAVMSEQTRDAILAGERSGSPYTLKLEANDINPVDQVMSFGHVHGIATLSSWLAAHGQAPQVRLGNWATVADLHDNPLIFFGALNNPWTVELTKDLRFRVEPRGPESVVVDRIDPTRRWSVPDYRRRGYDVSVDYGLVTRVIDPATGQVRISIGGICHYSSQSAAEFLTTPRYWSAMAKTAPRGWEKMNMQVVLEVKVTQKVPRSPKVVAWHFW
jgi:hypothetical protein